MNEKKFEIKTYRKSGLAMIYFPDLSKKAALKRLHLAPSDP